MADFSVLLREKLGAGTTLEEGLAYLRATGAHPVATIKAIREVLGVSLGEAKQLFSISPAWASIVRANEPLHDEAIRILSQGDDPGAL